MRYSRNQKIKEVIGKVQSVRDGLWKASRVPEVGMVARKPGENLVQGYVPV